MGRADIKQDLDTLHLQVQAVKLVFDTPPKRKHTKA